MVQGFLGFWKRGQHECLPCRSMSLMEQPLGTVPVRLLRMSCPPPTHRHNHRQALPPYPHHRAPDDDQQQLRAVYWLAQQPAARSDYQHLLKLACQAACVGRHLDAAVGVPQAAPHAPLERDHAAAASHHAVRACQSGSSSSRCKSSGFRDHGRPGGTNSLTPSERVHPHRLE